MHRDGSGPSETSSQTWGDCPGSIAPGRGQDQHRLCVLRSGVRYEFAPGFLRRRGCQHGRSHFGTSRSCGGKALRSEPFSTDFKGAGAARSLAEASEEEPYVICSQLVLTSPASEGRDVLSSPDYSAEGPVLRSLDHPR